MKTLNRATLILLAVLISVALAATTTFDAVIIGGPASVKLSGDGDGALTFLGLGNGSDEDLTLNLDDTSNTWVFTSSTGVNAASMSGVTLTAAGFAGSGAGLTSVPLATAVSGTLPVANGGNRITTIIKPTDEIRTSNTTITNDSALTVAVASGKTYKYTAFVYFTEESGTPGIGVGVNGPTNSFLKCFATLFTAGGSSGVAGLTAYASAGGISYIEGQTSGAYQLTGNLTTTASGNLVVAWRQSSSSADDTIVKAGSWLTIEEVP